MRWVAGEDHSLEVVTRVSAPGVPLRLADDGAGDIEVLVPEPSAVLRPMRTVAAGDPFHPANVRRLRLIGGFLVLGTPIAYFIDMAVSGALLGQADGDGSGPAAWVEVTSAWLDVPWVALVSGMVVAMLAEAFKARWAARRRRGTRLMPVEEPHRVVCHLDRLLEERGMTLAALAEAVRVTVVNLSVLKNNRAKAVRFSTVTASCDVLGCRVGDVPSLGAAPTH